MNICHYYSEYQDRRQEAANEKLHKQIVSTFLLYGMSKANGMQERIGWERTSEAHVTRELPTRECRKLTVSCRCTPSASIIRVRMK
jgi:hypothetical protein